MLASIAVICFVKGRIERLLRPVPNVRFPPIADVRRRCHSHRMKQRTEAEIIAEARRHMTGNKAEIEASKYAGCISCCRVFDRKDIKDWKDEWASPAIGRRPKRWSARCPNCGEAMVIGSNTGLLDDQAYLPVVKNLLRLESEVSGADKRGRP